ncbi:ATP-binding protein, partial [Streptomyces sp. NPDC002346]
RLGCLHCRSARNLRAYRASLDDLNDDVIEGDLLAQTVLKYAERIESGAAQRMTSTEWLSCLSRLYGDDCRPLPKGWPTTGKVLSDRLKRLQPTLAARGVLIDTGRTSAGRYLEMTRTLPSTPHEQARVF